MISVELYSIATGMQMHKISGVTSLSIDQGDDLVFSIPLRDVRNFAKHGVDLTMEFIDGTALHALNFFFANRPHIDSILTFTDRILSASELENCFTDESVKSITIDAVMQHHYVSMGNVISRAGVSRVKTIVDAVEDAPFVYHFILDESFPQESQVDVLLNNEPLPTWLTLKQISPRNYVITGIPSEGNIGKFNLQIVTEVEDGTETTG